MPQGPDTGDAGRLVVVIGPSGAGKDTLLTLARAHFRDDRTVVFPRRIVTREPTPAEDNVAMSEMDFAAAEAARRFAFWWEAHGLKYAVPGTIEGDMAAGRTVVCNVSRAVVGELRRRYAVLYVVLVTAPTDVLAARLAARGRPTDGAIAARIARTAPDALAPDAVIENVGDPADGAARLIAAIGARDNWFIKG
jgi:ribose 1,5-bisphosphokinase